MAVSIATRPEPAERLDRFFLTVNTPVGQEARIEKLLVSEGGKTALRIWGGEKGGSVAEPLTLAGERPNYGSSLLNSGGWKK